MRRIAISDIHGCSLTFKTLVDQVVQIKPGDQLFLLGDFFHRGPDEFGIFDFIWELEARGVKVQALMGNHDEMFLDACDMGLRQVEDKYRNYVQNLPSYLEVEGYLLVHAGLNFEYRDPLQDELSMRWIRGWESRLNREWLGDRRILHGHIRKEKPIIRQSVAEQHPIIGIDNGCFKIEVPGQGSLCAFDMDTMELYFQPNLDMSEPAW